MLHVLGASSAMQSREGEQEQGTICVGKEQSSGTLLLHLHLRHA